jgi:hypothetical protein
MSWKQFRKDNKDNKDINIEDILLDLRNSKIIYEVDEINEVETFDEWIIKKNIKTKDKLIDNLYEDLYNNNIYIDDFKNKLYKLENMEFCKLKQRMLKEKYRKDTDPLFKLTMNLRTRIYCAVKSKSWNKRNTTAEILGCDYETVKKHLENQFIDNMSWDNYGRWHIDHIKPLAKAETEEELYKRCHYTNLQPLWAADNLSKGAKEL